MSILGKNPPQISSFRIKVIRDQRSTKGDKLDQEKWHKLKYNQENFLTIISLTLIVKEWPTGVAEESTQRPSLSVAALTFLNIKKVGYETSHIHV